MNSYLPVQNPWARIIRHKSERDVGILGLRAHRNSVPSQGIGKVRGAVRSGANHMEVVLQFHSVKKRHQQKATHAVEMNAVL